MIRYKAEQIVHDILEAAVLNALDLGDERRAAEIENAAVVIFTDLEDYAQWRRDSGDPSYKDEGD